MAVYVNLKGKWTELGDNDSIENMVPEQFVNYVLNKEKVNKLNNFLNVSYNFQDYLVHISQIQSQLES